MAVLKQQIYCLVKRFCVSLEAYMSVSKQPYMPVSTHPYDDVLTHLHRCVLQRRPLIVAERRKPEKVAPNPGVPKFGQTSLTILFRGSIGVSLQKSSFGIFFFFEPLKLRYFRERYLTDLGAIQKLLK